ncbi:hypothetical protein [Chitinophaga pinensis]|uniref:Integral membrane protein n=1 Tax=Chitinophaga pinensis TaxID=79329 RepID=A0A5C6LQ33_9BACT|nr:hypothetical protein [Chitinophaga pinensis]TWV94312.1 hypothetical protein FEF09_25905 [Chitinophaga pinensis]
MLRTILRADFILGGATAIAGLLFNSWLSGFLGLPADLIIIIAIVTLAYAMVACVLAFQREPVIPLLRILIYANWVWTLVSLVLLIMYYKGASAFGVAFLVLQVVVVGGLAWLEGRCLRHQP